MRSVFGEAILDAIQKTACGKNYIDWVVYETAEGSYDKVKLSNPRPSQWDGKCCGFQMPWHGMRRIGLCDDCKRKCSCLAN